MLVFTVGLLLAASAITAASPSPVVDNVVDQNLPLRRRAAPAASTTAAGCYEIVPTPTTAVCGVNGYLKAPAPATDTLAANQTLDNIAHCKRSCFDRAVATPGSDYYSDNSVSCMAYSFDPESKICQLYQEDLIRQAFTPNTTSPDVFYDLACYNCPLKCPQTTTHNLIQDGGFETSDTLIGPWIGVHPTAGYESLPELVQSGDLSENAIFCPAGYDCGLNQYRRLCIGQHYTLSLDINIVSNLTLARTFKAGLIKFQFGDMYTTVAVDWEREYHSPSGWRNIQASFQGEPLIYVGPQSTGYQVYALAPGLLMEFRLDNYHADKQRKRRWAETPDLVSVPKSFDRNFDPASPRASSELPAGVYMDNFKLVPAPATFKTKGKSALINGGFESGSATPWKEHYFFVPYPYDFYAEDAYGGKHKIVSPGLTAGSKYAYEYYGGFLANFYLYQEPVPLKKGTKYLLSFDWNASEFNPGVSIVFPGSKSSYEFSQVQLGQEGLQTFQRVFTALGDEVEVHFTFLGGEYENKNGYAYIDNILLKPLA